MQQIRALATTAVCGVLLAATFPTSLARIAVVSVALHDVSNQHADSAEPGRARRLSVALNDRLTSCGYQVVSADSLAEAAAKVTEGDLYEHPDVAAEVGARVQAEWVIVPRLNRATPWVTDIQANVVRVRDSALVSNRIVELKGLELTPELTARVIDRGAAWMADQLSQSIEVASRPNTAVVRRCPP